MLFDNFSVSSLKKSSREKNFILLLGGFNISKGGIIPYQNVRINYKPDSQLKLELSVEFDETLFHPKILEKHSKNNLSFELKLYTRPCIKGEILIQGDQSCYECPELHYSIVDPMIRLNESNTGISTTCQVCPSGASCPGGSALIPLYGYWRASENSSKIVECISSSFCLGGLGNSSEKESNFYF